MASSLDLSLPEAPPPRRRVGLVQLLTLASVLAILVLLVQAQFSGGGRVSGGSRGGVGTAAGDESETERLERLAADLERRTLYLAAAEVWDEYLSLAELEDDRRAELIYRRGKCFQQGGEYNAAARCFSEVQDLPLSKDQKRLARQYLLECLSAMGKEAAREEVARTFAIRDETKDRMAVAVVGGDPVTREDLLVEVQTMVRNTLKAQGTPLPPMELEKQAKKIAQEQLKNPEVARQTLQQIILRQVLYREGLERGFSQDRDVELDVIRFRRDAIAGRVVDMELSTAIERIGPTDLANHYEAHKETYVDRSTVEFAYARFPDEGAAESALASGPTFPNVNWQPAPAAFQDGQPVPGIGTDAEIAAHLLALEEGQASDRVIEHDGAYYIFLCDKKTPATQLAFDAARDRVLQDLAAAKRGETLSALEQSFRQKFLVEVHDKNLDALAKPDEPSEPDQETQPEGKSENATGQK